MRAGCEELFVMGKPTEAGEEYQEYREVSRPDRRQVYAVLRNARCRTVLSTLSHGEPMDEATLAATVVAAERDIPIDTVSDGDTEQVRFELYHVHLPKLEATGFVSWGDGLVRTCLNERHEVVPGAQAFIEADRGTAVEYLHILAVPERRAVVSVLEMTDGPMELRSLARAIGTALEGSRDQSEHDSRCLALHHVHLPMLDQAGLVRYDHDEQVVELVTLTPRAEELTRTA